MNKEEQRGDPARAQKPKDPERQSWYNIKRLAQAILRHPENVYREVKQIISIADSHLEK
jgi:hypothetical protein